MRVEIDKNDLISRRTQRTIKECAKLCAELLRDPEQVSRIRRANHDYYRAHVEPAAHMRRVLDDAFA